jgi:hypothetical protein
MLRRWALGVLVRARERLLMGVWLRLRQCVRVRARLLLRLVLHQLQRRGVAKPQCRTAVTHATIKQAA